ncbi:aspartyl protease family protein [Bacteroides sp. 224]|uniref:aspartyl protease family protein n=1 Tax=Bacteroides sp. 224 TaxID=2302936 RepID=UPI0013D38063|nr:aspartyl protease family protein [Bacteroides sp. 224]NDV64623.1 hypothetical protein [Bacteroides sp. 224]
MNKIKKLLILLAVLPLAVSAQVNIDSVKVALTTFTAGLKAKDHAIIQQCVAPEFTVHTNTWPSAQSLLNIIWNNKEIESIELSSKKIKKEEGKAVVDVVFTLSDQTKENSKVAFTKDNKILFVDYFDRLFGASRYWESKHVATIPIEVSEGSIYLTLKLNQSDMPLRFLLDTGADGMAIRKSLADSLGISVSHSQNANVVGGQQHIEISSGNVVHLTEELSLKDQNMALFPKVRHEMDGIIGLNLVKRYITSINYDTKQIDLYTFGNREYKGKNITIPVKTPHGLMLLPSSINLTGDKVVNGNFIMDTGANYYLIMFSNFVRKNRLLLSGFKPESQASTMSLGIVTPVYNGKAHEFLLGDDFVDKDIPVTLQAGPSNKNKTLPDGSLGVGFFSKFNIVIDLLKNEVHLFDLIKN